MSKTLIVITGPTGVGKTATAIGLAQRLHCDIINADSRQIYRGIPICTAAPTADELAAARHHFVAFKDLEEQYSQRLRSQRAQGERAEGCRCEASDKALEVPVR